MFRVARNSMKFLHQLSLLIVIAGVGCGGAAQTPAPGPVTPQPPTGSTVQSPPPGFGTTPIFDEEFNGTSLNTSV